MATSGAEYGQASEAALLHVLLDRVPQFGDLRVAPLLLAREHEVAVHRHIEHTAVTRDQGQPGGPLRERTEQLLRRPRGAGQIVSRDAVLDADAQLRFRHRFLRSPNAPSHIIAAWSIQRVAAALAGVAAGFIPQGGFHLLGLNSSYPSALPLA